MGRKWSLISKFLPGRNENAVKNRFFSILKISIKKTLNEEEVARKIYVKIKVIKDSISIEHPIVSAHQNNIKTKCETSLSNMSISNNSFAAVQSIHKRMKIESPYINHNRDHIELEQTSSKIMMDRSQKGILIDLIPSSSNIEFGSLDCIRDNSEGGKESPNRENSQNLGLIEQAIAILIIFLI